jgi:hypothetical protein
MVRKCLHFLKLWTLSNVFYERTQNKFRLKVLRTVGILVTISTYNRCSVRLFLQLFVWKVMSYLHYLCLFAYSCVQHILCCVFAIVFWVLCTQCCQFLLIVYFGLPLRYSLTFIGLCGMSDCWNFGTNQIPIIIDRSDDINNIYVTDVVRNKACNELTMLKPCNN